jgi:hypothetical protein
MPPEDLSLSPLVVRLDTEIARLRREIWNINIGIRVGAVIAIVLGVSEIAVIVTAIIKGGGWVYGAMFLGFMLLIVGGGVAEGLSETPAEKRALEQKLRLTQIKRTEFLAGKAELPTTLRSRYKEDLPDLIESYKRRANQYRRLYTSLQLVIIVGSLTASAVTAAFAASLEGRIGAVSLTLLVGIGASCSANFRPREKSQSISLTANAIEKEFRMSALGLGEYLDKDDATKLQILIERVEEIRAAQSDRERELDQPSDPQQSGSIDLT